MSSNDHAKKWLTENFHSLEVQSLFNHVELPKDEFVATISDFVADNSQYNEINPPLETVLVDQSMKGLMAIPLIDFEKQFDFGVATFRVAVDFNVNTATGHILVYSKVFGLDLGESKISFENGVLQKNETLDLGIVSIGYDAQVQVLGGFSAKLKIKGQIGFGPFIKNGEWEINL